MPTVIFEPVNRLGVTWAGVMTAVAIQAVVLAALALLASRLLRNTSPAVRHALWLVVAAKLLLMPCWTWSVIQPSFWARDQSFAMASVAENRGLAPAILRPAIPQGTRAEFRESAAPIGPGFARFRVERWPLSWPAFLMIIWLGGMGWKLAQDRTDARRVERSLAPRQDAR